MMVELLTGASEYVVKGNACLSLNVHNTVWTVKSGSMAVFAVSTVDDAAQGVRRYLFEVHPGDAMFGITAMAEGESQTLISVAYEETHLLVVSLESWMQQANAANSQESGKLLVQMERWSDRLVEVFDNSGIVLNGFDVSKPDTFPQFHADFWHCLHQLHKQETEARTLQFRDRQQLNQQVTQRALGDLSSIFQARKAEFLQEGTALLQAAGAVGRALGIEIRPPARSENTNRVKDPLEAIARASRIRTRRVILSGVWWKLDCGALLAYTLDDGHPVALLPVGNNLYEVFAPHQRSRIPVNAHTAEQLSPVAYMFYRPLPERTLKLLEIVKFAVQGKTRDLIAIIVLGVASSLFGMLVPQATGILIDQAIPDGNRTLLFQIGLGLLAVSFGTTLFNVVQNVASLRVQTFASAQSQAAVWDRLLQLRVSFFRKYSTGDLKSRVSAINQIGQLLSGAVMRTILTSFFALLNLGLLFFYSMKLALVAVGLALVTVIVTTVSGILTRKKMRPLEEEKGEIFGLTVQLIGGVSKIRIAAAEERAFAYWSKRFSRQLKLMLSTEAIEDSVILFNTILPTISSILIFYLAVELISEEGGAGLSTGAFLAFNAAFGTFISGATDLSNTVISVLDVAVLWERAKPILEERPEVDAAKTDPGRLLGGIKLDRISFRYQDSSPLTLDNISIEANPGEFIALVGPSGSGKSTTLRLMLGFEETEEGKIYYDGQDLSGLDISAVRRQLGVVLQNGRINSASIFENVSGGARVTMDEAWEAARMAGFAEDVEKMPMGIHTVISEGGSNLSGGQRQRLLIARALVLKPKILIFDEATSALDNRTQAIVSESLERLRVTRIVIAHRLSTIRNADRIYALASGQVVQQGTFEELMTQKGLFADLMARQIA